MLVLGAGAHSVKRAVWEGRNIRVSQAPDVLSLWCLLSPSQCFGSLLLFNSCRPTAADSLAALGPLAPELRLPVPKGLLLLVISCLHCHSLPLLLQAVNFLRSTKTGITELRVSYLTGSRYQDLSDWVALGSVMSGN